MDEVLLANVRVLMCALLIMVCFKLFSSSMIYQHVLAGVQCQVTLGLHQWGVKWKCMMNIFAKSQNSSGNSFWAALTMMYFVFFKSKSHNLELVSKPCFFFHSVIQCHYLQLHSLFHEIFLQRENYDDSHRCKAIMKCIVDNGTLGSQQIEISEVLENQVRRNFMYCIVKCSSVD